jgi:hypothetical protein
LFIVWIFVYRSIVKISDLAAVSQKRDLLTPTLADNSIHRAANQTVPSLLKDNQEALLGKLLEANGTPKN